MRRQPSKISLKRPLRHAKRMSDTVLSCRSFMAKSGSAQVSGEKLDARRRVRRMARKESLRSLNDPAVRETAVHAVSSAHLEANPIDGQPDRGGSFPPPTSADPRWRP